MSHDFRSWQFGRPKILRTKPSNFKGQYIKFEEKYGLRKCLPKKKGLAVRVWSLVGWVAGGGGGPRPPPKAFFWASFLGHFFHDPCFPPPTYTSAFCGVPDQRFPPYLSIRKIDLPKSSGEGVGLGGGVWWSRTIRPYPSFPELRG